MAKREWRNENGETRMATMAATIAATTATATATVGRIGWLKRVPVRRPAFLCFLILAMLGTGGSSAQAVVSDRQQGPVRLEPIDPNRAGSGIGRGVVRGAGTTGVRSARLDQNDRDSLGLTRDDAEPEAAAVIAGLDGERLWRNTPYDVVLDLLERLPDAPASATLRRLQRWTLLLAAAPPEEGTDQLPGDSLLSRRAHALARMGEWKALLKLVATVPRPAQDSDLARLAVDGRLVQGDLKRACEQAGPFMENAVTSYWLRVRLFCNVLNNRLEAAEVGAGLLADSRDPDDRLFLSLLDVMLNLPNVPVVPVKAPEPLILAMTKVTGRPLPLKPENYNRPALLRWLGQTPLISLKKRLFFAHQAAKAGHIDGHRLTTMYDALSFSRARLASPVNKAKSDRSPYSGALMYRAVRAQKSPQARAKLIEQAMKIAHDRGELGMAMDVFAPEIADLSPSTDLLWFSGRAVRTLHRAGRLEETRRWIDYAQQNASGHRQVQQANQEMWPLLRLTAARQGDTDAIGKEDGELLSWVEGMLDRSAALIPQVTRVVLLLEALGDPVPAAVWHRLWLGEQTLMTKKNCRGRSSAACGKGSGGALRIRGDAPATAATLIHRSRQARAASSGRMGETILLVLTGVGTRPMPEWGLEETAAAVHDLNRVGLSAAAQALALEAVLLME